MVLHTLRHRLTPTLDKAAILALLYAAMIPFCLWLIVQFPFRLERLSLYFLAPLLPFLLAGMVVLRKKSRCGGLKTIFVMETAKNRSGGDTMRKPMTG